MPELDRELSEGQKTCLRLVAKGMSSKEIAKATGLSHKTVDTYLTVAISRLGASNRREAARLFTASELSEEFELQSPPLVEPANDLDQHSRAGSNGIRNWLRLPPVGGRLHDLSAPRLTLVALRIGLTGAVLLLAIVIVFIGLMTVL